MIKLAKTVKLPFSIVKGTYLQRLEKAKTFNKQLFSKINKDFVEKDISPDVFVKHIKKITKGAIEFSIDDSTKANYKGCTFLELNPDNHSLADRYKISIPLNFFDKKVALYDADIFMHEFFHFFCVMTNPKHLQRFIKMYEKNLFNSTEAFYRQYLYSKEEVDLKLLKKSLLPKFLKKFNIYDQIDFLQNSRYRLIEELNAYKDAHKYYNQIQENHLDLISEKLSTESGESFLFKEKIHIIEKTLKKKLNKARKSWKSLD